MIPPRTFLSGLCALAVGVGAGCVIDKTGQSSIAAADRELRRTQQRVSALEDHFTDELQTASKELTSVRKDSELNQVNLANSEALLEELLVQTQSTMGSLERLQRRLAELEEDQERLQDNMDFQLLEYDRRLAAIEQWAQGAEDSLNAETEGEGGSAAPSTPAAHESSASITVQRARAALAAEKPRSAVKLLKNFDKKHPDSPELLDAQLLYAQALREDGKGADAIAAYQAIIETHPDSPRLAEAMLALGLTLRDLGELEEARFFLGELISIYPGTPQATEAKKAVAKLDKSK